MDFRIIENLFFIHAQFLFSASNHVSVLRSFEVMCSKEKLKLSSLQWIPILHKIIAILNVLPSLIR